jgi:uncharacterized repeat protein (TIGR02543 family)
MKKGLIAGLALLVAFAFIGLAGCTDPDDGGKKPDPKPKPKEITINFWLNQDPFEGGQEDGDNPWQSKKINVGTAYGTLPTPTPWSGYTFIGWYDNTSGRGEEFTSTTIFREERDYNLYGDWVEEGKAKVTFDPNFIGNLDPKVLIIVSGTAIPSAQVPSWTRTDTFTATDTKTPYIFGGWYNEPGCTTQFDITSVITGSKKSIYAKWTHDMTGVIEKVTLANSWFVPYLFVMPPGKQWSNYDKITADYMLDADTIANGVGRAVRLLGNYKDSPTETEFSFYDGKEETPGAGNNFAILGYNALGNGPRIICHLGGAYGDPIKDVLAGILGAEPLPDTWFTVTYLTDGSKKNNEFKDENRPANAATSVIFGLGLPGQDNANTHLIRNVTLKGKTGTDDLIGIPIVFDLEKTETPGLYPAFIGYTTTDGTNGYKEANREYVGLTAAPAAIEKTFTLYDIVLNHNYPQVVIDGGTAQPANGEEKTDRNANLSAAQLDLPKIEGYRFDGWFTVQAQTGGSKITPDYKFSSSRTIYARWTKLLIPTEPLTITSNAGLRMSRDNDETAGSDGFWVFTSGGLLTWQLPEAALNYAYDKITAYYTIKDTVIPAGGDGTGKLIFKPSKSGTGDWGGLEGFNDNEDVVNGDRTWSRTLPLADFNYLNVQDNSGLSVTSFALRFTKIEFTATTYGK